ncbi:MAG TPA: hypothetical protein VI485_04245 [Vicinamibacterales bacterium]|nr:hypothetical protein [Vicinamibacterales bacterium]
MLNPDEQEFINDAIESTVKGALAPIHDVVRELAGESASEIGSVWAMQLRFWKVKRAARLAEKLRAYLEPIGINRRPVALKLLMGTAEYGAIEEEDELQDFSPRIGNTLNRRFTLLPMFPAALPGQDQ